MRVHGDDRALDVGDLAKAVFAQRCIAAIGRNRRHGDVAQRLDQHDIADRQHVGRRRRRRADSLVLAPRASPFQLGHRNSAARPVG